MAGMHQFTDTGERCVSPGCRAPSDARPSSEILEEIRGAGIGSRRARAQTHRSVCALGSWRWGFRITSDAAPSSVAIIDGVRPLARGEARR